MAEGGLLLVTFMLSFSLLLVVISAVHRYMRNIIIPGVAILMFVGAILPVVPNLTRNAEDVYGITERIPEIILYVIIPILIFESARKLSIGQIKKEAIPIGFFAIVGVIITILIIGIAITAIFQIPFIDGLLFGTILAATDPVAVGIIFKKFPIPRRLNLIIEGESLFNDATGVISFNVVKGIIFSGIAFSLLDTSFSFLWTMVGAIAFGTVLGWIGGKILNKWKADEYVDFTFSLGLADPASYNAQRDLDRRQKTFSQILGLHRIYYNQYVVLFYWNSFAFCGIVSKCFSSIDTNLSDSLCYHDVI